MMKGEFKVNITMPVALQERIRQAAQRAGMVRIVNGEPIPNATAWFRSVLLRALEESEREE